MDKESFQEVVRRHYAEDIQSVYSQCGHVPEVDRRKLSQLLGKLARFAEVEGLSGPEFVELVQATLPGLMSDTEIETYQRGHGRLAG